MLGGLPTQTAVVKSSFTLTISSFEIFRFAYEVRGSRLWESQVILRILQLKIYLILFSSIASMPSLTQTGTTWPPPPVGDYNNRLDIKVAIRTASSNFRCIRRVNTVEHAKRPVDPLSRFGDRPAESFRQPPSQWRFFNRTNHKATNTYIISRIVQIDY